MARINASTSARNLIIGLFLCLLAAVFAILPIPIFVRSVVLLFLAYIAIAFANIGFSYLIVLIVPVVGIFVDSDAWLVLSPVIMSAGLLAMLAFEYTWRRFSVVASPLFWLLVPIFVHFVSQHRLFALELPWNEGMTWWQQSPLAWIILHGIVALIGSIIAVMYGGSQQQQLTEISQHDNNKVIENRNKPTLY